MSNQEDNIKDNTITQKNTGETVIEQKSSLLNNFLWFFGIACFILATIVNQYLPAYWQPASNIWVRIGVIIALIVAGIVLLLSTQQGRGFSKLLKDTQVELRRVTWPSKDETIEYTWKVLLAIFVSGVLIYIIDGLSSIFVNPFIY